MQKLGEAFYGRLDAYDRALAATGDDELAAALRRNVLGEGDPPVTALRLATYVRAVANRLEGAATADLGKGKVGFPDLAPQAPRLTEVQG
jgi:cytochrome b pre-mRNA-processing protein 3